MTRKRFHKLYAALWARTSAAYHLPNTGQSLRGIRGFRGGAAESYADMWMGMAPAAQKAGVGKNGW